MIGFFRVYITLFALHIFIIGYLHANNTLSEEPNLQNQNNTIEIDSIVKKSERFYDSLETKANKNLITKEIHNLIINGKSTLVYNQESISETPYIPYEGKIIRNIRIKQLNVFGPSVMDTTVKPNTIVGNSLNKIHFKTNRNILEQHIFIRPGSEVDPFVLADNERVLRELPYIKNARIEISHMEGDSVDILILTKDLLSVGFDAELTSLYSGRAGLWDRNIFGLGHEFETKFYWHDKEDSKFGYSGMYLVNNIWGSFIKGKFLYEDKFDRQTIRLDFTRDFFTPNIRYAGGATFEQTSDIVDIIFPDTVWTDKSYKYQHKNFWLGRSIALLKLPNYYKYRTNLFIAGKYKDYHYFSRPGVEENLLYIYHNRKLLLGSIALSRQGFKKSSLIYNFGQTEDIPYGTLIQLTGGYESNEFTDRPYFGIRLAEGLYFKKYGYIYTDFQLGGFWEDEISQGVIQTNIKYFTSIQSFLDFKHRLFLNIEYKKGINRYLEEFVDINDHKGIRDLSAEDLRGTEKLLLGLESVLFTPYYLYGFRFVFFGFADIGWASFKKNYLFYREPFSGFGIGVRLRNERLVFNTFQLKLTYFPNIPHEANMNGISLSGERTLKLDRLYATEPAIIEF